MDKLAIFSLKNERMIRLFLGQEVFWPELKTVYENLKEYLTGKKKAFADSLHFYIYRDNGLLTAAEDSLQKAETALQYGAKSKNPFVIYNQLPEEVADIKEDIRILQAVREALAHDGIVPHFQGIYDNSKGRIEMYEALIRIKDAQGNLYYPGQFLSIAKEYDLYGALSIIMVKKVFSNLLHIIKINADILKIDGEIIKVICQDENCREFVFVTMINEWCRNTGKEVIGEFVENENIQQIMEKIGIAHSQGYYFAKPARWKDIAGKTSCV